jgi:hypothetical protein
MTQFLFGNRYERVPIVLNDESFFSKMFFPRCLKKLTSMRKIFFKNYGDFKMKLFSNDLNSREQPE